MRVPPIEIGASYIIPLEIINFNNMKKSSMKKSDILIAGAATSNITPLNSQFLFGYPFVERMSEGVHDWLLSSALYLASGNNQAMLISNDVIYVSKASVARIREGISKKTGIPADNIMVHATHTHSGPLTVDCMNSSNDPVVPKTDVNYVRYMEDKIIEAGCNAFNNASPAEAGFILADATGVGTNRHDPEGPADLNVPFIVFRDNNKEYLASLLVCHMHPTVLHEDSKLYSGDFPAFARDILQKNYFGCECPVLYFTGAAGNQSPRHVTKSNTFEEARRIGGIIADAIGSKIRGGIDFSADIPVNCVRKHVDLPRRKFPSVEEAEKHREKSYNLLQHLRKTSENIQEIRTAEVDWFGSEELLHLSKMAQKGALEEIYASSLPAEVQMIKIGEWKFAAWPGEIFIEYALELKSLDKNVFLVTLSNGELQGYIATEEAAIKGYYEASNSVFDHTGGELLVTATLELLKKVE